MFGNIFDFKTYVRVKKNEIKAAEASERLEEVENTIEQLDGKLDGVNGIIILTQAEYDALGEAPLADGKLYCIKPEQEV